MKHLRRLFCTESAAPAPVRKEVGHIALDGGCKLPTLSRFHRDACRIFNAAVYGVQPQVLIRKNVTMMNEQLHFKVGPLSDASRIYKPDRNVYICGFGKAVGPMAAQLQQLLRPHIKRGVISVPVGYSALSSSGGQHWLPQYPIEVVEGAKDNVPDEGSFTATKKIIEMVESLKESDLLFVLITGGGSALAPMPKPPLTLNEKQKLIRTLSKCGASIEELNAVRIRLSALKGGQLLGRTKAQILTLILSDIIDSPLHLIASGPTVSPPTGYGAECALDILRRYKIEVDERLESIIRTDTLLSSASMAPVQNFVIGSNKVALEAAKQEALSLQYHVIVASDRLKGDARTTGRAISRIVTHRDWEELELAEEVRQQLRQLPPGSEVCVLFGGETTVRVTGSGSGGRSQELALAAAIALHGYQRDVVLLSAGTDGIDGPTDAAGACIDQNTVALHKNMQKDAEAYLENNDSYNFFKGDYQAHVKTGHTGTNVMDIQVLLFETGPETSVPLCRL